MEENSCMRYSLSIEDNLPLKSDNSAMKIFNLFSVLEYQGDEVRLNITEAPYNSIFLVLSLFFCSKIKINHPHPPYPIPHHPPEKKTRIIITHLDNNKNYKTETNHAQISADSPYPLNPPPPTVCWIWNNKKKKNNKNKNKNNNRELSKWPNTNIIFLSS